MLAEYYWPLYHTHVTAVVLSLALFVVRGALMLARSEWLKAFILRVFPHIVDTVLLLSGIGLALALAANPLVHHWLTAKIVALVVYIVLGMMALRRGRTLLVRSVAFLAAIAVFGYIYAVAITKHPLPIALLG